MTQGLIGPLLATTLFLGELVASVEPAVEVHQVHDLEPNQTYVVQSTPEGFVTIEMGEPPATLGVHEYAWIRYYASFLSMGLDVYTAKDLANDALTLTERRWRWEDR